MKIIESNDISPVEVLETLEEEEEGSLEPIQKTILEHLRQNTKIESEEAFEELKDELEDVESLKEKHIYKILEILPEHPKEVEALFSKDRIRMDDSEREKIAEICSSYST